MVLQRMQNVVPFLILFFLKKLYQHSLGKQRLAHETYKVASSDPKSDQPCTIFCVTALGICFFFAYTSLIFNLNQRFTNQVALKVRHGNTLVTGLTYLASVSLLNHINFHLYLIYRMIRTRVPLP